MQQLEGEHTTSRSSLLDYLNQNFPANQWHSGYENGTNEVVARWSDTSLMHHFFTQHAVNVFVEGSVFYMFKYEMCLTDTWKEEIKEAR